LLLGIINLTDKSNIHTVKVGLKMRFKVGGLGARYFCGNTQRLSRGARYPDRVFRSLLRRKAPEEGQICSLAEDRLI
jgi:hypothetical protein